MNMENMLKENVVLLTSSLLAILSMALVLLKIRLTSEMRKIQKENSDKYIDLIDRNSKQFRTLVERMDNKVTAFSNFLVSNSVSHISPQGSVLSDTQSYYSFHDYNVDNKSNRSLFNFRQGHYGHEKKKLCKHVLEHLLSNEEFKKKKIIYLMIDSGSTVYPIFQLLCEQYWNEKYHEILKKVEIITNNMPGVQSLIKHGRRGSDTNAEMLFKCHVLPGIAEGKYGAILGDDGPSHLQYFINKVVNHFSNKDTIATVSLITGNYISLKDGILWRGDYHGQMKNAYIVNSDYIYIISPLGKIFDNNVKEINSKISDPDLVIPTEKCYRDLRDQKAFYSNLNNAHCVNNDILDFTGSKIVKLLPDIISNNKEIYLFTTKRMSKHNNIYPSELQTHFQNILTSLKTEFRENLISPTFAPSLDSEQVIYELHLFSEKNEKEAFLNYEFPHREMRNSMRNELF